MIRPLVLTSTLALLSVTSSACECAGPATFCESLDGPWSDPDIVVLGVKLDEFYYGMHVKVVSVFEGNVAAEDTILVWGDNGALCRWYVQLWNNGDTVLWAFHNTDFMGNIITAGYPPDLEQPGDYHISACGTYWLPYANGSVTGPLAPGVSAMSLVELQTLVTGCASTGITEVDEADPLVVRDGEEGPWLSLTRKELVRLNIMDALGRLYITKEWDGSPVQLGGMATGTYLVQVRTSERMWSRKIFVR